MTLSSDTFPAWALDMPDNKAFRPLREQIGDEWFLHWRDGKAFGIPKVREPAKKFGTGPHALACTDHLSLLSSRIDNILPLKFPKYKALRARPFTFLGQRKEIVAAVTQKLRSRQDDLRGFQIRSSFQLEAKIIEARPDQVEIGLFLDIGTRWEIHRSLADLASSGINLSGLYVIRREVQPGQKRLVGSIGDIRDGKVFLTESFDGTSEILLADVQLEGSKMSFSRCLKALLKSDYDRFEDLRRSLEAELLTGPALNHLVDEMHGFLLKDPVLVLCEDALTATVGERIAISNSPHYRSWFQIKPLKYCFDAARSQQSETAWQGIKNFGPFSRTTFAKKSPSLLVVYPDSAQGPVEVFLRHFSQGIQPVFSGGFGRLFSLNNVSFVHCKVPLLRNASSSPGPLYKKAIEDELARHSTMPDAAFVILSDEHARIPDPEGPYIQCKAALMLNGIPTQQLRVSKVTQQPRDLQYILRDVGVALYAKLNGTPWTVDADRTVSDELVIGLGLCELSGSRVEKRQRFVGVTTVFQGDGNYLLGNVSRECAYADYADVLRQSTVDVLEEVKKRNGWQPGDTVRVIFHSSKPLKNIEVADIMAESVKAVGSEQRIEFAFLTVTIEHPFLAFDPHQRGMQPRYGQGKPKGELAPERGTVIQIGKYTRLLCTNGPSLIKLENAPLPAPLLVHIHRKSDFVSLDYLAEQVLKFTALSWRSVLPAKKPVSIYYSELIAEMLARLKNVDGWSPGPLNVKTAREPVVSVSDILGSAYAKLRTELKGIVETNRQWPAPEPAFAFYSCASLDRPHCFNLKHVQWSGGEERIFEAPVLAAIGFLYGAQPKTRPSNADTLWTQALTRLSRKEAFPRDRESFFYRPIDLLGICIGTAMCPAVQHEDRNWLQNVLSEGEMKVDPQSVWNYFLSGFAAHILGVQWQERMTPVFESLAISELSLLKWLLSHPNAPLWTSLDRRRIDEALLRCVFGDSLVIDGVAQAAVTAIASELVVESALGDLSAQAILHGRNTAEAEEIVSHICRRFPVFANQLLERHDGRNTLSINDEYDVQDLIHAVLKLHFEDVRPEEWAPSFGGSASRMDFLLKPQRLVVETKMTRANLDQKKVVNELTQDIARYQAHPDCDTLVCFVYDPDGRCHNPVVLENDLTKKHSNLRVVVHVEPKRL